MPDVVDNALTKLAALIREGRFEELERGGYIVRRGARGFVLNRDVKRA